MQPMPLEPLAQGQVVELEASPGLENGQQKDAKGDHDVGIEGCLGMVPSPTHLQVDKREMRNI